MSVIAMTGATGFIGRSTLAHLLSAPTQPHVRALVRNPTRLNVEHPRLTLIEGNLNDALALEALVSDADAVVHLAGAIAGSRQADFDRVNMEGTAGLADAVRRMAPGAHALLVSSLAATQPDLSWYARSKSSAERLWREQLPETSTILRPPAVYGPDDPALADFWRLLARGWLLRLGPVDARFSMVHVDDVVESIDRLLHRGPSSTPYAIAGPQPEEGWRWRDIARVAEAARNGSVRTLAMPAALLRSAGILALVGGRLTGRATMLSPGKVRELRHVDWVCDNLAISAHLDWQPSRRLEAAIGTLPGWTPA